MDPQNSGLLQVFQFHREVLILNPYSPHTPISIPQPLGDENTELDKLRDALTTSLASPGGVEMEESPDHNGALNEDQEHDEKADFPSEGPTPSKHMSTMSFTRTVSEDVNWAEEEDDTVPEIQGRLFVMGKLKKRNSGRTL